MNARTRDWRTWYAGLGEVERSAFDEERGDAFCEGLVEVLRSLESDDTFTVKVQGAEVAVKLRQKLAKMGATDEELGRLRMSAKIGDVVDASGAKIAEVYASTGGVEVNWLGPQYSRTISPIAARNYAAILVRAGDEVERMRAHRTDGG